MAKKQTPKLPEVAMEPPTSDVGRDMPETGMEINPSLVYRTPKKYRASFRGGRFVRFVENALNNAPDMGEKTKHEGQQKPQGPQSDFSKAILPPQPSTELAGPLRGLGHDQREEWIKAAFSAYAEDYPDRAGQFAKSLERVAEEQQLPEMRRTLGLREAARRISKARGINLSHIQLRRYYDDSEVKIGAPGPGDEPRFSPAECDAFILPTRKRGPKPKNSKNST